MSPIRADRRVEPRTEVKCPCKVFDQRTGKYIAGSTWNVSPSGALVQVDRPLKVAPGDRLYVGIAFKRRQGMLFHAEMTEAVVVRSVLTADEHLAVAVRLLEPMSVEIAELHVPRRAA